MEENKNIYRVVLNDTGDKKEYLAEGISGADFLLGVLVGVLITVGVIKAAQKKDEKKPDS